MCGIAGYCGTTKNSETLEKMTGAIKRRGPDDFGTFENSSVGLGFRRLSIIDLSGGHQPMLSRDKNLAIVFNGEIYNFQEVKKELEKAGAKFDTKSDTEVILKAYEKWGDLAFEKLNGMFALAIWDEKRSKLILVRDRLGKKPLYWTITNNTLYFASELKALIKADTFKKELDLESVALFFRTDYIPTPRTIFKNVFKLEPATVLTYKNGSVTKKQFWQYPQEKIENLEKETVLTELKKKIDEAVKERLVSDVPLGLFLSGGLDSAIIAESASRQSPGIRAFTIGFEDKSHDETAKAELIAKKFGLNHKVEILSEEKALEKLDEAVELLDEPFADPAILPQLLLSEFTKKDVTVALSGDGGDELLLGYQHIPAHVLAEKIDILPKKLVSLLASLAKKIPSSSNYFSLGFKAQRFSRGLSAQNKSERDLAWRGAFEKNELQKLLKKEVRQKIDPELAEKIMDKYMDEAPEKSWSAWSWSYLRTYLMDDVLVKVDRATMWHSLEGRNPLLDQRVVAFLLNLPDKYKLEQWKNKGLFKEILKDKLPQEILNSSKHGFGVPTAKWLNGSLGKKILELSEKNFLDKQGVFEREYILKMLEEHKNGTDRRKELWSYLMFQLWYTKWSK